MLIRRIARPMLSAVFISRGIDALRSPKPAADAARPTIEGLSKLPDPVGTNVPSNAEAVARVQALVDEGKLNDKLARQVLDGVLVGEGRPDEVVAARGIGIVSDDGALTTAVDRAIADNPDDQWHRVFDVNVVGIVRVTRAALPHLRDSSHAAIVNTCSIAATAGLPQRALYSATKGAVLALTRAMAADHLADGIRVNCVNPGTADTPWIGRLLAQAEDPVAERAALEARQPLGRLVSAEEVAAGIAYLASPAAASVTGTALEIDGGMAGLRLRPRS